MRLGELARRVAASPRNIRFYQERGLLPPPVVRGRTGYYTEEHQRRLDLIRRLQARGFTLEAIRQVLDAWSSGRDIGDLLGLQRNTSDPSGDEALVELADEEWSLIFPEGRDDAVPIEEAVKAGLLVRLDDGGYASVPVLLRTAVALLRMGLNVAEILGLLGRLEADTRVIARHLGEGMPRRRQRPVARGTNTQERLADQTQTELDLSALAEDVRTILVKYLDAAIRDALDQWRQDVGKEWSGPVG